MSISDNKFTIGGKHAIIISKAKFGTTKIVTS